MIGAYDIDRGGDRAGFEKYVTGEGENYGEPYPELKYMTSKETQYDSNEAKIADGMVNRLKNSGKQIYSFVYGVRGNSKVVQPDDIVVLKFKTQDNFNSSKDLNYKATVYASGASFEGGEVEGCI